MKRNQWEKQESIKGIDWYAKKNHPYWDDIRIYKPKESIKSLRKSYHGKWIVELNNKIMKMFPTRKLANAYAKKLMKKIKRMIR